MSRRKRPNLPGAAFHLTGRLQHRETLFTPELRTEIIGIIREQVFFGDVDLLAYAIMLNHLHLVIRQGELPLGRFMQPIMRRIALLVHRVHTREGHVFERGYRDRPCSDPLHLRNAIVYTHLNPVRAGICTRAEDYAWTSHNAWLGADRAADGQPDPVALGRALPLFAAAGTRTIAELRNDYLAFVAWREALDVRNSDEASTDPPVACLPAPALAHGDAHWLRHFCPVPPRPEPPNARLALDAGDALNRVDLADIAKSVATDFEPGLDLALVRSRWGGSSYIQARHAIIRRAAAVGYKGVQIAAYLRISTRAVSAVLSSARRQRLSARV